MRTLPFAIVAFVSLASASSASAFELHADLAPSVATSLAKGKADCTVAETGAGLQRRVTCTLTHTSLSGAPTSAALFRTAFPLSALASVTCDVSASPILCTGDVPAASNTYSYLLNEQMSVGISTAASPAVAGEISGRLLRVVDGGAADGGSDGGVPDSGLDAGPTPSDASADSEAPDAIAPSGDASTPPGAGPSTPPLADDAGVRGDDVGPEASSCSAGPAGGASQSHSVLGGAIATAILALVGTRRRRR
ncbi:MAG: MYXO-CTERM sorting domain-containing protein [Polyangiaceae bacterium]